MDIFQKNMNYLKNTNENLYHRIDAIDIDFTNYSIMPLLDNYNNVQYTKDQESIMMYDDRTIISDIHNLIDAAKDDRYVVFYGLGLGYHAFDFIASKNIRKVIVIEPDIKNLMLFMNFYDLEEFSNNPKVDLLISNNEDEICELLAANYENIFNDKVKVETFGFYEKLYKEDYRRFLQRFIVEYSNHVISRNTKLMFTNQFIRNGIYNFVSYLEDGALLDCLADKYKNVPAIIVGAGPSLNKQLDELKTMKDKALIFAVGSGMNVLDKNQIKHHFKVAIDADSGSGEARYFKELKDKNVDIIYAPSLHFKALEEYKGNKFYCRAQVQTEYQYIEKIAKIHTEPILGGGTVSMLTVDIARRLGCNPIILLGQDFSYTNLQNYADGAVNKAAVTNKSRDVFEKVDIYGNTTLTDDSLYSLKLGFDDFIEKNLKNWDVKIYNCTEGGIGIEGVENARFKDICDKYCLNSIDGLENRAKDNFERIMFDEDSKLIWSNLYNELKRIQNPMKTALDIINKMEKSIKKGRNDESISKKNDKIKSILKKIQKKEIFNSWIEPIVKAKLSLIDNIYEKDFALEEDIWEQQKQLINLSKMQFEEISKMCDYIMRVIEATFEDKGIELGINH